MNARNITLYLLMGYFGISTVIQANVLSELYKKALQKSELISQQSSVLSGSKARVSEAYSAFFPLINISAQYNRQPLISGFASDIFPESQTILKAQLSQSLFKGFRDFNAIDQLKWTQIHHEFSLKAAQLDLAKEVVKAFYSLKSEKEDASLLKEAISMNKLRLIELKKWRRLGRVKTSSLFELESSIATQEADQLNAELQIALAEKVITFLTDQIPDTLSSEPYPPQIVSFNWQELALKKPEVMSAEFEFKSAQAGTHIATGAYLPSIDLIGNYYPIRDVGALKNSPWDASIIATLPLYLLGTIDTQITQAKSLQSQKEQMLSLTKRKAIEEIENSLLILKNGFLQCEKLKVANTYALENYTAKDKEFKLGLISLSDVLIAQTNWVQTQRLYQKIKNNLCLNYELLKISAGIPFPE